RGRVWTRPSGPGGARGNLRARITARHWAGSDGHLLVPPMLHYNRGIPNKDAAHAPHALRPNPDGGERPPGWLLQLTTTAQACDRSHQSKPSRVSRRVGNTPGKRLGHGQQLGSTGRPRLANLLSYYR